jgi:hypothetical protein
MPKLIAQMLIKKNIFFANFHTFMFPHVTHLSYFHTICTYIEILSFFYFTRHMLIGLVEARVILNALVGRFVKIEYLFSENDSMVFSQPAPRLGRTPDPSNLYEYVILGVPRSNIGL